MKNLTLILTLLVAVAISSCKKDPVPPPAPPAPFVQFVKCEVDGEMINFIIDGGKANAGLQSGADLLTFIAKTSNNTLSLYVERVLEPDTFLLKKNAQTHQSNAAIDGRYSLLCSGSSYDTTAVADGTVIITYIDKSLKHIEGTFSFDACLDNGIYKKVRNGEFALKYE